MVCGVCMFVGCVVLFWWCVLVGGVVCVLVGCLFGCECGVVVLVG